VTQLIWAPASGAAVTLATGQAAAYRLQTVDGLGPVSTKPVTSKAPGQPGSSALDITVAERIINAQLLIQGTGIANYWSLRAALASAMAEEPVDANGVLALGLLTFKRGNALADLEIPAKPYSSSMLVPKVAGSGIAPADLEWFCPYPFFRATSDTVVTIASPSTPTNVANPGDARCPPLIQIYGDLTLVRVTNLTTGDAFELAGEIPAGQYVEVSTTPGAKYVQLVNGSTRTNWMGNLNMAVDSLFSLAPGTNSIQWTRGADGGSGARDVVFTYRPRTRGI